MGGGEAIAVATGPDSWWYLNGKSQQWCRAQAIAAESEDIKLSPTLTVVWKPANGRVRVINGQKGFCYLSGICGALRGGGEAVHITLEQDGWWYISGKSRIFLHAMATCVPWPPHRLQPKVTFFTWRRGDQPVKMIPKNEGFCVLKYGGEAALLGLTPGPFTFDLNQHIVFKGAIVRGIVGRRLWDTWYKTRGLLESGAVDLSALVTHEFELEDFDEAYHVFMSGESGKIMFHL